MARTLHKLNTRKVAKLARERPDKAAVYGDGGGLFLRVRKAGGASWFFVTTAGGKRREIGLGGFDAVDLDQAREKAARARAAVAGGRDPKPERLPPIIAVPAPTRFTFGAMAEEVLASLERGWKNPKHRQQWTNTLKTHCRPVWEKAVDAVDTADIIAILLPIWSKTPETASRVRGRIERVLDAARAKGLRDGENPARWRGHLFHLLPARANKNLRKHHPAMPYAKVPAFLARLKNRDGSSPLALEFLILTAARTNEVLGMKWGEVDLDGALWTVPADRMKMQVEHRVPLSGRALEILRALPGERGARNLVFLGQKQGRSLSNMSLTMLMRKMGDGAFVPHGFRSTFRDWAGEETDFPREIAEAALAHQVGNEVERAYRRGDALAKRRVLMNEWAGFLVTSEVKAPANDDAPASPARRKRTAAPNPYQPALEM